MRFLVCPGTERQAGELFRTEETVPGVSPRCLATAFKVIGGLCLIGAAIFGPLFGLLSNFRTSKNATLDAYPVAGRNKSLGFRTATDPAALTIARWWFAGAVEWRTTSSGAIEIS